MTVRGKAGGRVIGFTCTADFVAVRFEGDESWSLRGDKVSGSYTTTSRSGKRGTNHGVYPTREEFDAAMEEAIAWFLPLPDPGRWWQVLGPDDELWAETSDEGQARDKVRPGDTLWRQFTRTVKRWNKIKE